MYLKKISKFFLYLAPFSVLIVSTSTLFPFIVGKYVFFRTAVSLALIFYLWHWAFSRPTANNQQPTTKNKQQLLVVSRRWLVSPLVIAVSIFVAIFLLAGALGVNPSFSFWSNFERGEGGFQMLYFLVFFLLLAFIVRDERSWRTLFMVMLTASVLLIGYGLGAALEIKGFVGPNICGRFQGSLGNPAYVATYLLFILFYSTYLFSADSRSFKKWLWLGLLVFFAIFLLLTQTRGAFMGLGVGLIAFSFYLAATLPSGLSRKIAAGSVLFLIILAFLVINKSLPSGFNPIPFCSSASRLVEISVYDPSSQPRLWTWQSAIKGWKDKPLLGWGPENFPIVFDKYFDIRHHIPNTGSQTWFDRAHSIYLDYLSQIGIIGLLSYLAIFAVYYWLFFRTNQQLTTNNLQQSFPIKKQPPVISHQSLVIKSLFFALPIAYLVQGIVLFEVFPIYINLFIFLAFSNWKLQTLNFKS